MTLSFSGIDNIIYIEDVTVGTSEVNGGVHAVLR